MHLAVPSGLIFGGCMYYLGKFGVLDALLPNLPSKQLSAQTKQQKLPDQTEIKPIVNHTFTPDAITSIERNIQLNPKCKIIYSTLHKTPLSVHQFLDLTTIQGQAERAKSFHTDKNIIPDKFASKNDHFLKTGAYRNFGLNRGHMAAASDFSSTQELKNSTFSYANVVPQNGYNNGGIWNTFQRYCRSLLKEKKCDTIQIISGPIFNSDKLLQGHKEVYKNEHIVLLKNGMVVPPRLYKIIKCNIKDQTYASGFTFYNQKTYDNSRNLSSFQQQIEEIQNSTGLVFNFKDKLTGKLSKYDEAQLTKTKYELDKVFYSNLFKSAKDNSQMNDVLRRAYEQKISMNEEKQLNANRIQTQGLNLFESFKSNTQLSQCQKLVQYLMLHKKLFYLGGDIGKCKSATQKIEQQIKKQIFTCRNTASLEEQLKVSKIGVFSSKRYAYPHNQIIMELFPKQNDGARPDRTSNSAQPAASVSLTPESMKKQSLP